MATVERGCLAIGDIAGYTTYLAGVELEHSQDVLADLMGVVVMQMRGLLHLAKLEGDAVFCYNREDEATGPMLLTMTESCYSAFARRLMNIRLRTTCECDACRLIPRLNLKFAIHFGQYVAHDVAGSRELMGRDVIVVHRLLKNSVKEKTGLRGYALYTQAAMQRFGLDPASLGAAAHTETYDDVGEIAGYVFDLEARWQEEQQRRAVYIAPGEGVTLVDAEMAAPPALVWDYLTSPAKRPLWQLDTRRVDQHNPRGLPGVGTTNHCVHGEYAVDEEILDWKPFQYFTERATTPAGVALFTSELTPLDGGRRTRATMRLLPDGGPQALAAMQPMVPALQEWARRSGEVLANLLARVQTEGTQHAESSGD